MIYLNLHVICSCIFMHTYLHFFTFLYTTILVIFWLSSSLSFFLVLVYSMTPKRKSTSFQNLLRFRVSSSSDPTPSSVRFCDDEARKDFSENFCRRGIHSEHHVVHQIFLTLTYPLSFIVGVGSHFVTSWSLVLPWSYRSFTQICTKSILQYLISSLAFEVCRS